MNKTDFTIYQSPFSWRYGSDEMRKIFSEENKYRLWRKIWVALARAQAKQGLVSQGELKDLEANQDNIDIQRIWEIEKDTRHDVVAAIKEFAEKAKIGGGKIHLGATSMDVVDNADMVRINAALDLTENKLQALLKIFSKKITLYVDTVCMGYTHLQPAEPTTLGYRLSFYAQDLLTDLKFLKFVRETIKGKGIKGAVGTSASYVKLVGEKQAQNLETEVMNKLGIEAVLISNQTYPRKFDYFTAISLSSIAQSLSKFAFDLRIMQSSGFGEWQEPFGKNQVGSSAMPFKRNPWNSEQICSLARLVENLSTVMWENAANMLLERTLDDSPNRRVTIPEIFLAVDEILNIATKIIEGLIIHEVKIKKNLDKYWPFSATESIILEAVKNGADRQKMHEILREISMQAWEGVQNDEANPMESLLLNNAEIKKYLTNEDIKKLLNAKNHIGNAKDKSLTIAGQIAKLT